MSCIQPQVSNPQPISIGTKLKLPFYISRVNAGFPSPAEDYIEKFLDLNEHLIEKPAATFFVKVNGDSMKEIGIRSGDLLIIDRSKTARNNSIVLAVVNGEFTVKRLIKRNGKILLKPENPEFKSIEIVDGMDFEIWGVVVHAIHSYK